MPFVVIMETHSQTSLVDVENPAQPLAISIAVPASRLTVSRLTKKMKTSKMRNVVLRASSQSQKTISRRTTNFVVWRSPVTRLVTLEQILYAVAVCLQTRRTIECSCQRLYTTLSTLRVNQKLAECDTGTSVFRITMVTAIAITTI